MTDAATLTAEAIQAAANAAYANAQYRAANGFPVDPTNTAILNNQQVQQYLDQRADARELAKHNAAWAEPRNDVRVAPQAAIDAYAQQRGNTISSGGTYQQTAASHAAFAQQPGYVQNTGVYTGRIANQNYGAPIQSSRYSNQNPATPFQSTVPINDISSNAPTRAENLGYTRYDVNAMNLATQRPGYSNNLGDSKTRFIQQGLGAMQDMGFNVANPNILNVLNMQRNAARQTPTTIDDRFYMNELQKGVENYVETSSAYHHMGQDMGVPIPANRFEYQGDLAVELLKGQPGKASEWFSPASGEMSQSLVGGEGLQQYAWRGARDGTGIIEGIDFGAGINKLLSAEGQYGPYGKLYGGPEYRGSPSSQNGVVNSWEIAALPEGYVPFRNAGNGISNVVTPQPSNPSYDGMQFTSIAKMTPTALPLGDINNGTQYQYRNDPLAIALEGALFYGDQLTSLATLGQWKPGAQLLDKYNQNANSSYDSFARNLSDINKEKSTYDALGLQITSEQSQIDKITSGKINAQGEFTGSASEFSMLKGLIASNKSNVEKYNEFGTKQQNVIQSGFSSGAIIPTGDNGYIRNPDTNREYGAFSEWNSGITKYLRGGATESQIATFEQSPEYKNAGVINWAGEGAWKAATNPAGVSGAFLQGVAIYAGMGLLNVGLGAAAAGSVPGAAMGQNTLNSGLFQYGLGTVLVASTAWEATRGFTAPIHESVSNLGGASVNLAAMGWGGLSPEGAALASRSFSGFRFPNINRNAAGETTNFGGDTSGGRQPTLPEIAVENPRSYGGFSRSSPEIDINNPVYRGHAAEMSKRAVTLTEHLDRGDLANNLQGYNKMMGFGSSPAGYPSSPVTPRQAPTIYTIGSDIAPRISANRIVPQGESPLWRTMADRNTQWRPATQEAGMNYIRERYPHHASIWDKYKTDIQQMPPDLYEPQMQRSVEPQQSSQRQTIYAERQPIDLTAANAALRNTESRNTKLSLDIPTQSDMFVSKVERAMIMQQYDLSPTEIAYAKTHRSSLNDILALRETQPQVQTRVSTGLLRYSQTPYWEQPLTSHFSSHEIAMSNMISNDYARTFARTPSSSPVTQDYARTFALTTPLTISSPYTTPSPKDYARTFALPSTKTQAQTQPQDYARTLGYTQPKPLTETIPPHENTPVPYEPRPYIPQPPGPRIPVPILPFGGLPGGGGGGGGNRTRKKRSVELFSFEFGDDSPIPTRFGLGGQTTNFIPGTRGIAANILKPSDYAPNSIFGTIARINTRDAL